MKIKLLSAVLALGFASLITLPAAQIVADPADRTWSIVVHFRYLDGFEYDYVLRTGVPTQEISTYLAECGASHWTGSVVRYHCYPRPE
jgi:hypothetical protein